MTPENEARALRAYTAMDHYDGDSDESETNMVDLLTDLRHWADMKDLDFYACLDTSYAHYLAEKQEGETL